LRSPDDRRAALDRGARAEALVAEELVRRGWVVLARNWRARGGELDVVVERAGVLRFVEVKARDEDDPTGLEAIGHDKRRKLVAAAEAWLLERGLPEVEVAFLVAVVSFEADGWSVEWVDDAF
jgi:putative endonuclease